MAALRGLLRGDCDHGASRRREDFETAIAGGPSALADAPDELVEFLQPRLTLLDCLDRDVIARGAEAFRRLPMPAWIVSRR